MTAPLSFSVAAPGKYCPLCGNTSRHWYGCDSTAHTFDPGRLAETSAPGDALTPRVPTKDIGGPPYGR